MNSQKCLQTPEIFSTVSTLFDTSKSPTPGPTRQIFPVSPPRKSNGTVPYGLIQAPDPNQASNCPDCNDPIPCRTRACTWQYEYNMPPAPMYLRHGDRQFRVLQRKSRDLYRDPKTETIPRADILTPRRMNVEYQRQINSMRGPKREDYENVQWDRFSTQTRNKNWGQNRGPDLNANGSVNIPARPSGFGKLISGMTDCLHCRTACSSTQVDCPICGGIVRGQCRHAQCNAETEMSHDPL